MSMVSDIVEEICCRLSCYHLTGTGECEGKINAFSPDPSAARKALDCQFPQVSWDGMAIGSASFHALGLLAPDRETSSGREVAVVPINALAGAKINGGTLGCLVEEAKDVFVLGAQHVIPPGVSVLSSGIKICTRVDVVGGLGIPRPMDCAKGALDLATAKPLSDVRCNGRKFEKWKVPPRYKDPVSQCGAQTSSQGGEIECAAFHCMEVGYMNKTLTTVKFYDTILIRNTGRGQFAEIGDSGSIVFRTPEIGAKNLEALEALGMIFAESSDGQYFLATRMDNIFTELGNGFDFYA